MEATADLIMEDNDTRMDISLNTFESLERWEDGVRVDQLNKMIGGGTFGFSGEDENASVQINGTIHDFHQEQEDGYVTVDDLARRWNSHWRCTRDIWSSKDNRRYNHSGK